MNYKNIIENLEESKVIKLLEELGVTNYKDTPTAIIFPTVCHNTDANEASMKLYYYKDTKFFFCYTDCGGMSVFKFLKNFYETRNIEYNWYDDIYLPIVGCTPVRETVGFTTARRELLKDKYQKRKKEFEFSEIPIGILDVFIKTYPEQWLLDGITKKAMDKFNILFSISQNKIIIPHYDVIDRLIGIRGRALNEWEVENVGKYMPVQIEQVWYSHKLSLNLYGLNKNKENIRKTGNVFIFEGEKAVLQFENFEQPNCAVAVCGSSLNKFQIDLLMRTCQPTNFIICFDKEDDSDNKYFEKIWHLCRKYHNYGNFSFIYDVDNLLKLKESPSDCGEAIFNKLLKRRVLVI